MRDLIKKTISLMSFMVLGTQSVYMDFVASDGKEHSMRVSLVDGEEVGRTRDAKILLCTREDHFKKYMSYPLEHLGCVITAPRYFVEFTKDGQSITAVELKKLMIDTQEKEDEIARLKAEEAAILENWDLLPEENWSLLPHKCDENASDVILDDSLDEIRQKTAETPKTSAELEKALEYPKIRIHFTKPECIVIGKEPFDSDICPMFFKHDTVLIRLFAEQSFFKANKIQFESAHSHDDVQKFNGLPVIKVDVIGPVDNCKVYEDSEENKCFTYGSSYGELKWKIVDKPRVLQLTDDGTKINIFDYEDKTSMLEIASIAEKNTAAAVAAHGEEMLGKKPEEMPLMFKLYSGGQEIPFEDLEDLLDRDIDEPVKYFIDVKDLPSIQSIIGSPFNLEVKWS